MDILSAFAQANAQDLLVEEKRKRVEEDKKTKRHDTLEQKRKGMRKGAREPKEAKKVKGKTCPTFKLALHIKATTDIKHVTEEVMGMCVITSKLEY